MLRNEKTLWKYDDINTFKNALLLVHPVFPPLFRLLDEVPSDIVDLSGERRQEFG